MSTYSLKVTNKSGAQQNIAVYQQYPDLVTGLPLVWFTKSVPDGNDTTFTWSIQLGFKLGNDFTASRAKRSVDIRGTTAKYGSHYNGG
ncbi:hypothetical protein [Microcystis aeruginosa]|uniref:hypothetical protein n=1 Tax=Microcystis aeruginosa TaxID=1126 RepID=UPI0018EEFBCA|nr:hypothetical protein [Microcystis aeruginosa]